MDDYFGLLNQALSDRNSIWTFYTIIVTTALGTAFTDGYRKLGALPRAFLTFAVGTAIWFNFYSAIINVFYVNELVSIIRDTTTDDNIKNIFSNKMFFNHELYFFSVIVYVYIPINIAVFIAMWWDEFGKLHKWIRKKFNPVKNDLEF